MALLPKFARMSGLITGTIILSGCAAGIENNGDPYEATNRKIFAFNDSVDRHVLLPTAKAYVAVVPEPARKGIHNVLANLSAPVAFANYVLQGDVRHAGETTGRFLLNSTIGIGGLFDLASRAGLAPNKTDFGLTLASHGVQQGVYLVVPVLGPSSPRDLVGQGVDVFLDPTTYVSFPGHTYYALGREALTVVDLRAQYIDTLESIERSSVDYYATMRSLYQQSRKSESGSGQARSPDLPNF